MKIIVIRKLKRTIKPMFPFVIEYAKPIFILFKERAIDNVKAFYMNRGELNLIW